MPTTINFPSETSAGKLFLAERCYCLDETLFDWFQDAKGTVTFGQDDCGFTGIILEDNVPLRREIISIIDPTLIQLVYFRNPFKLTSLIEVVTGDLKALVAGANRAANDIECELLAPLEGLRALDLAGSRITDAGLKLLCKISSLESLVICDTEVTDEGIESLHSLTNLRELDLSLNAISSEGVLSLLDRLLQLEELRLSDTPVGDEVIEKLARLKGLKYVDLADTAVSEKALDALRNELPDCDVWP